MNILKTHNLVLALLFIFNLVSAQEYADKDFYLLDSLIVEDLHQYDRILIDSMMELYQHEKEDTIKFGYIEQFIENSWDDAVTSKYNNLLRELVESSLKRSKEPTVQKKLKYYKAVTLGNKGYYFDVESQFDSAQVYYQKSHEVFKEINHFSGMGNTLYQIALTYKVQGNTVAAIEKYKEAADLCEKVNDYKGLAGNYMSIADIMSDVEEVEEAKIAYRKSIEFAAKVNDLRRLGVVYNKLAILNLQEGEINNAIKNCDTSIAKLEEINYVVGIANVMNTLVSCYLELGDNNKALKYAKESLVLAKTASNNEILHIIYNNLAKVEISRKNYDEALKHALKAETFIDKTNNASYEKNTINSLAKIYKIQSKYQLANEMLERKAALDYKIFNDEIRSTAIKNTYQNRYEQQKAIDDLKNTQQLELANEQKRRTRLGMFGAALLALITAIFAYLIFSRLKVIRKQKAALDNAYNQLEEAKKNELAVSNLKALQSQMNPHFIFNALNSVQDLVLLKDIRNSNKYLGKFSDLIRKILLSSKEQFISLEEEIEILSLYLDLEKLRFGEEFKVQLECNVSEVKQEEIQLPAMFIQPYIENAIKHGLFHKIGEKELLVQFSIKERPSRFSKPGRSGSYLQCIVQDNGIGQERAAEMKIKNLHLHTGFSTEAINERIRLLNETLDQKIELQIEDLKEDNQPIGTKIVLQFPL